MVILVVVPVGAEQWIWAVDGWNGWSHTSSGSGSGIGQEYGPALVNEHGEQGTFINPDAGTTSAEVERTFIDLTGNGWDSFIFRGSITASDVPGGRWVMMDVNGQQVFGSDARSSPPGNGQDFEIQGTFPKSSNAKI